MKALVSGKIMLISSSMNEMRIMTDLLTVLRSFKRLRDNQKARIHVFRSKPVQKGGLLWTKFSE